MFRGIMKSEGNHQGQGKEYIGGTFTSRGTGEPILKVAAGMDATSTSKEIPRQG